jgi:hypothetical protein
MINLASSDRRRIHSKASSSPIIILIVLFVSSFMVGCSSDSGSGGGGGGSGGIDGTWKGTAKSSYLGNISFTATITNTNNVLSGTITIPAIYINNESLKGTLNGSSITFGDISGYITFTGTINSSSASGTYDYMSSTDTGTWTATHQ